MSNGSAEPSELDADGVKRIFYSITFGNLNKKAIYEIAQINARILCTDKSNKRFHTL